MRDGTARRMRMRRDETIRYDRRGEESRGETRRDESEGEERSDERRGEERSADRRGGRLSCHVPNHLPVLHFLLSLTPHHILNDAPLRLCESAQVWQSCSRRRSGSARYACRWRRCAPRSCASCTRRRRHRQPLHLTLTALSARSLRHTPIARSCLRPAGCAT